VKNFMNFGKTSFAEMGAVTSAEKSVLPLLQ
jgi:hypothetical protein